MMLEKQAVLDALEKERQYLVDHLMLGAEHVLVHHAINVVSEMEGTEQPEIVRCKECRQNGQCSIQFKFANADNPEEWFCGYGKRK